MSGIIKATNLEVTTIKDKTNSNTAMTIDSSGRVFQPAKPMMSVRGQANSVANNSAVTDFKEVNSWSVTDVNIGNCLSNGRFVAPVTGNYHLSAYSHRGSSTDYRALFMFVYNGSSYTQLITVYSGNDYKGYTIGGSLIYPLTAGHEVLVGWDNSYSNWNSENDKSSFTCYLLG